MKYFIDTEFIEAPFYLEPISIAVVAEDGREFYAVVEEFDVSRADPWVIKNVIPKLPPRGTPCWMSKTNIASNLRTFIENGKTIPEFWAYFADYDWILFVWLLGGRMVDLPKDWPKFCLDLKQSMVTLGISKNQLPSIDANNQHDALVDARWGMSALTWLFSEKNKK